MKKLCLLFLISISLISCDDEEPALSTSLQGQWKWVSNCDRFGTCTFPTEPSDGSIMTITSDVIEIQFAGSVSFLESYELKNILSHGNSVEYEADISNGSAWTFIVYPDNTMSLGLLTTANYKRIK